MASASRPLYKQVTPSGEQPFSTSANLTSQYSLLFRRNYVFLGVVFASAFGFEMAYETATDRIWDSINKGRQWKDIRAKYVQSGDGDDDEE